MTRFASEEDLGRAVVAHFTAEGWDVYQEVDLGAVADVVAVQGGRVAVVECKNALSLDVLAQAADWTRHAHWCFAAVPVARGGARGRHLAMRVADWLGVGVLEFDSADGLSPPHRAAEPRLNRRADAARLLGILRPEHKTFAPAGSAKGGRFTEFKATCAEVSRVAREQPGITLKALVDTIRHHYATGASARAHLGDWIEAGKIPGVALEREGRIVRVVWTA